MQTEVIIAKSTHTAIPELKREEKTNYFVVIGKGEKKLTMNIGEKSYNTLNEMVVDEIKNTEEETKKIKNERTRDNTMVH